MPAKASPPCSIKRLAWADPEFGIVETPSRPMRIFGGFGSGLSMRAGEGGTIWAICDRGPNLKLKTAIERYGLTRFESFDGGSDAKIMPRLDLGPAIAELRVEEDRVELVRTIRLANANGDPLSGLPIPAGGRAQCEPALDLDCNLLDPSPDGVDSEGLAALPGGGFWISDEYGPSLLKVEAQGRVELRLLPSGMDLAGAGYPCRSNLPAIAAKRQLNRGFEAIALSPGGNWLFVAFQSPLAHPDEAAHEQARHVRIWRLDCETGEVAAQYAYRLDDPKSFLRDGAKGEVERKDLKVSELIALGEDSLLVLERGSETTKIYRIDLGGDEELPSAHLDLTTRPTLEELSAAPDFPLAELSKHLLFSTDGAPEVAADLEGMAVLSPSRLLLVNDNDFGTEGAETSFWRIDFAEPVLAGPQGC
jgi:hypothetical protein